MTNQGTELSTITIVEKLFNFIKDNFDTFGHHHISRGWWIDHRYGQTRNDRGNSWAPFIEAFFVIEGEKTSYEVGHCYRHKNVEFFISDIFQRVYDETIHPCDSQLSGQSEGIDVSWRTKNGEYILALEHSEDSLDMSIVRNQICKRFNHRTTADGQLRGICDEIHKLRNININSKYNIIVSRPHIRDSDNKIYQNVVDYFKKNIENILLNINPINEWIIILITPEFHVVNNPINPINIKFHCYQWNANILEDIPLQENSFQVKMDNNSLVKKC